MFQGCSAIGSQCFFPIDLGQAAIGAGSATCHDSRSSNPTIRFREGDYV